MTAVKQDKERPGFVMRVTRILLRLALIVAVAFAIGSILNKSTSGLHRSDAPAGLTRGMLQGAFMPLALPSLAMGKDVVIYAPNNTGRTYKLGYTIGVNLCGLLFFGFSFWRLSRLKKMMLNRPVPEAS